MMALTEMGKARICASGGKTVHMKKLRIRPFIFKGYLVMMKCKKYFEEMREK